MENDVYHLELFISSTAYSGELTIRHVQGGGPDEHYIKDVHWVHRDDLQDMVIYPEILKDAFWDDLGARFSGNDLRIHWTRSQSSVQTENCKASNNPG